METEISVGGTEYMLKTSCMHFILRLHLLRKKEQYACESFLLTISKEAI